MLVEGSVISQRFLTLRTIHTFGFCVFARCLAKVAKYQCKTICGYTCVYTYLCIYNVHSMYIYICIQDTLENMTIHIYIYIHMNFKVKPVTFHSK